MSGTIHRVGLFFFFLAVFFGLFFGLNYPEIQRQSYVETTCELTWIHLSQQYKCGKVCPFVCKRSSPFAKGCDDLLREFSSLSPVRCQEGGACPSNEGCNNGYVCCTWSRCCKQVCTTNAEGHRTCREKCTDCSPCFVPIPDNQCHVVCSIVYDVLMKFNFLYENGEKTLASSISKSFGTDKGDATKFYDFYNSSREFPCYYNPSDPKEVVLDVNHTGWKWAITTLFGIIPSFALFCVLTCEFYLWCVKRQQEAAERYVPRASVYRGEESYATTLSEDVVVTGEEVATTVLDKS